MPPHPGSRPERVTQTPSQRYVETARSIWYKLTVQNFKIPPPPPKEEPKDGKK
jgi:hypothetical protein